MIRAGRPEAAEVVLAANAPAAPSDPGRPRLRGCVQGGVALAVAGAFLWLGHRTPGTIVATIGSGIVLAALVSPNGAFAAIERGVAALGRGIGRALTWLLLPAIFYAFFVPFGALFRRGRRDAMRRFFDADAASYWSPADPRRQTPESHARQY